MPAASATSAAHPPVAALPVAACTLDVGARRELPIPARLAALAPQYFHPNARGDGFDDLVPGTRRYRWYDPAALDVPVDPPPDMAIIVRATKSFYFGWADDGALRVARRSDRKAVAIGTKGLDAVDAVETPGGDVWLLAARIENGIYGRELHVMHLAPSLAITERVIRTATDDDPWDRRLGLTADGRLAVVWVTPAPDGLEVVASWLAANDFAPPARVDHVAIDRDAARLSLRSATNLRVAPDGRDRLAFAWRPIVPREGEKVDLGSQSAPPSRAATADVRIGTTDASGATTTPKVHPTRAELLEFTTGVGPWPLAGDGMASAALGGHAIFFWIDGASPNVVMATPGDAKPRVIASGAPRLVPRAARDGLELLLLQSVGPQALLPIVCR